MANVVIFSDASIIDTEHFEKGTAIGDMADTLRELPARSAGPHRIKTEVINQGLSCEVVDFFFYFTHDEIAELCDKLINSNTQIVGFSTTFWFSISTDKSKLDKFMYVVNRVKSTPNIKLVLGGTLAANFADKLQVDATFNGFSEKEFISYIGSLCNKRAVAQDFTLSTIEYSKSDCLLPGESVTIEIARGCIFKCAFCAYPLNGKKKFDYIKTKETLYTELVKNYEDHGIHTYTFSDDTFNDSTYKLEYLHDIFTSLPFKLSFTSYLRLDLLNAHREQIPLLIEMGLMGAFFGVETFNRDSGKIIGKNIDPDHAKDLLHNLKSNHWGNNVNITVGLISGLPYETDKSHAETIDWIKNYSTVDRIRPVALGIPNPLLDKYPFKSKFQIDAQKYGFYWPNPKSNNWKNMTHHVNTFENAVDRAKEIYNVSLVKNKVTRGNFGLPLLYNLALVDDKLSLNNLLTMPIDEFNIWLNTNKDRLIFEYISSYKRKKLLLS